MSFYLSPSAVLGFVMLCAMIGNVQTYAATTDPRVLDVHWTVEIEDRSYRDSRGSRELKMRIPVRYAEHVLRDSEESRRLSRVNSRGVHTVTLGAWLPDSTASQGEPNQRVSISIQAIFNFADGTSVGDLTRYQARKHRAYRMTDLYGLQRFRGMRCDSSSKSDTASERLQDGPPTGCHEIDDEDVLLGVDEGQAVHLRCPKENGLCSMRTALFRRWSYTLLFPREQIENWRELRRSSENFLIGFVI